MIKIDFTTKPTIPEYVIDKWGYKRLCDENGNLHSYNDLPAFVYEDGTANWFKHGTRHRDNGLPAIVYSWGSTEYWLNGKRLK